MSPSLSALTSVSSSQSLSALQKIKLRADEGLHDTQQFKQAQQADSNLVAFKAGVDIKA